MLDSHERTIGVEASVASVNPDHGEWRLERWLRQTAAEDLPIGVADTKSRRPEPSNAHNWIITARGSFS